jgi:hypothetical protein
MSQGIPVVSDTNASYNEFPVYATKFKCMLSIGTTVMISPDSLEEVSQFTIKDMAHDELVLVGLILSYNHQGSTMKVNLFQYATSSNSNQQLASLTTGIAAGIKELVQTDYVIEVYLVSTIDVAFIFCIDDIICGKAYCQGIRNVS